MDPSVSRFLLTRVITAFPEDAGLIERLVERDEAFLAACEDFSLVCATLTRLREETGAEERPDLSEYAELEIELRHEIEGMLKSARADERR